MKKFLTYSVVAATIAWSMGVSAVLPAAAAYSATDGDVVKVAAKDRPAVYYISGGKKYLFVNRVTYSTWASAVGDASDKFATLKTITQAEFDAIDLGGNVTARAGVSLVKFDNSDINYAVAPGAKLCKLADAATKTALYGSATVATIQSSFEANYTKDATCALTATSKYPDGTLVKSGTSYYYVSGGKLRAVSTDAFTANGFKDSWAKTVADTSAYGTGSALSSKESAVSSPVAGASTSPTSAGALSVSLSSVTPAAATVIIGDSTGSQVLVPMVAVNLTASSAGDVKITKMMFERTGVSADTDIIDTYLYEGNTQLIEGGSISSKVLTFNNASGIITIPAGQTKTVMLKTDMLVNLSAGKTIGFNLTGVTSNASSVSGTPVAGNLMSTANVSDLGYANLTAAVWPSGSANVDVNAGEKEYEAYKFTLTAQDQDLQLVGIKLTEIGTIAKDDLQNIKLTYGGTVLATGTMNDNNEVYFDLASAPYEIAKGNSKTFTVKVDVVKGSTKNFRFSLQYAADLQIKDKGYGVMVPAYQSGTTWTVAKSSYYYDIQEGTGTLVKDASSPSGNVVANATNVKLATFKVTATGEDVKVKSLNVLATATTGAGIDNGKVYYDGIQVGSTKDLTASTSINFTFGSSFVVPAGTSKLVDIYGDVRNTAGTSITSGTITISASTTDAQGVASLSSVTLSEASGNALSVSTVSSLSMAKYTAYGNQSMTSPAAEARIGSFTLSAPASEGVNVENIYIAGATSGEFDGGLTLKVNGTTIVTKDTLPSSGTSTINTSGKLNLAAGETKVIDVYSNVKSGLTTASVTLTAAADGTTPLTNTSASTSGATLQTISVASGSLSVDTSASKPDANIVIAGATSAVNSVFFSAANESYTITNLTVTSTVSASSRSIGAVILEYTDENGATKTATGYLNSSDEVNFNGLSIWVPRNVGTTVTIKAMISTIESGAVSGDNVRLNLKPSDGTATVFTAIGKSSGSAKYTYTGTSGITGNAMIVRRTKPTIALVALPSSVLNDGTQTIARFSISADAAGDVTWKNIGFTYATSSGVAITDSTIYLYKDGDSTALNSATSSNPAGYIINVVTTNEQTITKGTSQTYVLKGTITGSASDKSLSVNIGQASGATTAGTSNTYALVKLYEKSFVWADRSGTTTSGKDDGIHTSTSDDWCDSNYVKTIPSDSQTLSR